MKKYIKPFIFITLIVSIIGCDSYLDVNEDPNVPTDVPPELLLKGMELADTQINAGHLMRISQMWSGQLLGVNSLYKRISDYNITSEESNDNWGFLYHGVMTQNNIIQETSDSDLLKGMANVIEAHAVGTNAILFGNIPYSDVGNPDGAVFDTQLEVFGALQTLLDTAIDQLSGVAAGRRFNDDIFLNGKASAWMEVAYTLKARYFLVVKNYPEAYQNAQMGISSPANSLRYAAAYENYGDTDENSSLYYLILTGSRAGDLSNVSSYIQENLLNPADASSRNNTKTDESRRRNFLILDEAGVKDNVDRISYKDATMPLVTYEENLMILAETGLRTIDFAEGLKHLNTLRNYLDSGNAFKGDPDLLTNMMNMYQVILLPVEWKIRITKRQMMPYYEKLSKRSMYPLLVVFSHLRILSGSVKQILPLFCQYR